MSDVKDITVTVQVKAEELVDACIKALVEGGTLVEVVRCCVCKWCLDGDEHEHWCNGFGSPARLVTLEDYCSRGEEKHETKKQ